MCSHVFKQKLKGHLSILSSLDMLQIDPVRSLYFYFILVTKTSSYNICKNYTCKKSVLSDLSALQTLERVFGTWLIPNWQSNNTICDLEADA